MASKAKIYFGSIQHGQDHEFCTLGPKVDKIIELLDFSTIKKQDKVAIKMHLGFNSGYQTIPVYFVRQIVKAVKKVGGWPFVTDNPTSVYNAVERGYTQETCGCPIIPIAGVKDGYTTPVEIGYKTVETLDLAGALRDADVLIDLTHAKGHGCSCYGGAIKNIALGGYSGPSRWEKIHGVHAIDPYWDAEKCTPEHAKKLVESCPYGALKYNSEKHKMSMVMFACRNELCLECQEVDRDVGSLKIVPEQFSAFQEMMAISAKKVLETFDEEKRFFLNYALAITPHCDCMGMAQPSVVRDIGVLGSRDIVGIEAATLDLIKDAGLIKDAIPPYFKHVKLDSSIDLHPFERLWGPLKNPYQVVDFAVQQGLGTRDYELIEILPAEKTLNMAPPKQEYEKQPSFY
jgi:hypothetical protein